MQAEFAQRTTWSAAAMSETAIASRTASPKVNGSACTMRAIWAKHDMQAADGKHRQQQPRLRPRPTMPASAGCVNRALRVPSARRANIGRAPRQICQQQADGIHGADQQKSESYEEGNARLRRNRFHVLQPLLQIIEPHVGSPCETALRMLLLGIEG